MTDSMNFGPDWIRNLSSEGSTAGGTGGGTRYQLADYRYGREEMLALFDKSSKPPASLTNFKSLCSETSLLPLALLPTSDEERGWQGRPVSLSGPPRGRGGSLERGGRVSRGRGGYQYSRATAGYEGGWGNGEQPDWSPRKEYNQRTMSMENWRRARGGDDDDGWRNVSQARGGGHDKWGRSTSWRGDGDSEERVAPSERGGRTGWHETNRPRRSWDCEDHLPEWATENPTEGGGTFDERGAFHGSDDEQIEGKPPNKRETGLQKSISQQHITQKSQPLPLSTSKSTMSLIKHDNKLRKSEVLQNESLVETHQIKENGPVVERKKSVPNIPEKLDKEIVVQERAKSEGPPKPEKQHLVHNGPLMDMQRNEESDFERLQEDFVLKLVVDEEPPKQVNSYDVGGIQPPPNLVPNVLDKWFYQDPQGQMQGPFANIEMAEWFKAGYFSNQLKVRRQCDERFYLLGELIAMCNGANPFQSAVRFPTLKNDITKIPDAELMQFQLLTQMAAYKQAQARIVAEPWSAITLQQQEMAAQRLVMQQQPVPQDLQYMQPPQPPNNPLMHMINQMQQANKLPGQGLTDKPSPNMQGPLDPHLAQLHMGNLLSMQNRLPNRMPTGMTTNLPGSMPPESLSTSLPSLHSNALSAGGLPVMGMQVNIPASMAGGVTMPTTHTSVEQVNVQQENDPISSLLKQLQQQKQSQQMDSMWQQSQFGGQSGVPPLPPHQWQSQPEMPMSMWDLQQNNVGAVSPPIVQENQQRPAKTAAKVDKEKEGRIKEEMAAKELKKRKEQEEKLAKKEAEEKRKQEQRKQEADKRAAEEKKRKEEERVKRELEKAKKEAEDKRMRELEEKRKLKEQRKAEEEARKRSDELKKQEEEKLRQEVKEQETRRLAEERRLHQEQLRIASAKVAPWSQSNSNVGTSLADIQKAEREKRSQEVAMQVQRMQEREFQQQQQQQQQEKLTGIQLNWAKKPVEPRKVKSLAEIQAEEQERLAKQAAESRLQKDKEVPPVTNNAGSIWNGQNLSWASASATNSQWSSSSGGFWDDSSSTLNRPVVNKPSTVSKSNSANSFSVQAKPQQQKQQQQQPAKGKASKKEEASKANHNNNNNGPSTDEFTKWCYKTLSNISSEVDVPTFITFLRDIESAFEIREYCKEYLGENNATQQFASQFLEKRRSFKPKSNAHKDDMCSPAPAVNPSLQHSTEFQEVKGKNKKNKKSKMLKVDARILGFNVTSAPDRINVGDRDYGDNS